jgi:hypothetical protein
MNGAPVPVWAVALVLAVIAPFAARALALVFERRARERSTRLIDAAFASPCGQKEKKREQI